MAFVCNDCHRTWPDKRNKDPPDDADSYVSSDGICPECYDEPEEDDDDVMSKARKEQQDDKRGHGYGQWPGT